MAQKPIKVYRGLNVKLEEELEDMADYIGVRIKSYLRDTLEQKYKDNIQDTYTVTGSRGEAIQKYNKTHKHQKASNYHHTGLFLKSLHAYIDGDTIKIKIDDLKYDADVDGEGEITKEVSTRQVYKWLTRGTRKRPKYPYYPVEGKKSDDTPWAKYVPTPKHPFNQLTIADMNEELRRIKNILEDENNPERKKLIERYKKIHRKRK